MRQTRGRENISTALFVLLATAFVLVSFSGPVVAQVQQEQATLTVVVGTVEIMAAGTTTWRPATVGSKLAVGDQIRALEKSEVEMQLTDGSVIKVVAQTRLQIRQLDVDPTTRVRTSSVHLAVGLIRAVVAQAAARLVSARQGGFSVSTPTAVAAVRGSDGIVSYGPRRQATTVLSFSDLWTTVDGVSKCIAFVVPGTIVRNEPERPCDVQPMPQNFQAGLLSRTLIHTPTGAGVTVSPVTPQTLRPPIFPAGVTPTSVGAPLSLEDLTQGQDGVSEDDQAATQAALTALEVELPPSVEAAVKTAFAQQPPESPPPSPPPSPPTRLPFQHQFALPPASPHQ